MNILCEIRDENFMTEKVSALTVIRVYTMGARCSLVDVRGGRPILVGLTILSGTPWVLRWQKKWVSPLRASHWVGA